MKPKVGTKSPDTVIAVNLKPPEVLLVPELVKSILYDQLHCCTGQCVGRIFPHSVNWQGPETQYQKCLNGWDGIFNLQETGTYQVADFASSSLEKLGFVKMASARANHGPEPEMGPIMIAQQRNV